MAKRIAPPPWPDCVTVKVAGILKTIPALFVTTSIGCRDSPTSQNYYCCDFGDLSFTCTGKFKIENDGTSSLTVTRVSIKNASSQFKLDDTSALIGTLVPAGSYALFMIPTADRWTVVLNKDFNQPGAFNYKKELDLLRIPLCDGACLGDPGADGIDPASKFFEIWQHAVRKKN